MKETPEVNPELEEQLEQPTEIIYESQPSSMIPFNIFLDGQIGEGHLTTGVIKELLFWENKNIANALNNGPIYPIILHISSFGGDVYDTLQIIDTMKGLETPVITYCSGKAMSGAALILMAGLKGHRLVSPNSWVMIHELSSLVSGPLSRMTNTSDHLRKLQKQLEQQISKSAGIERVKLSKLLQNDQYFTAKQSVNQGICDRITKNVPKIIEGISMAYFTEIKSGAHEIGNKKNTKNEKNTKKASKTKKIRRKNKK